MSIPTQLGWRLYSLLRLVLQPHSFFAQLYSLDWYQSTLHEWYNWLQPSIDGRVLEVGCSSGDFSAYLVNQGHHVTALDHSSRAIHHAQKHHISNQLDFLTGDALQLTWKSARFDITLAASLLNVLDKPKALLEEMRRVTKAKGTVSCFFPTPAMHRETCIAYVRSAGLKGFSANALTLWGSAANKLDVADVENLFRDAELLNVQHAAFLDGMVAAVCGTVK